MSDFMQLFSAKIAFSKTIFNFPDVLLPRPLSPRFGLLITVLGYHRVLPTEIIATRNLNVTGDIFAALFFFFSVCRDITHFTLKEMLRPKQ